MRRIVLGSVGFLGFLLLATPALAAPITYRHGHFLYTIDPAQHPEWRSPGEKWTWNGVAFDPPAEWRVDGDQVPALPPGVVKTPVSTWNRGAIEATITAVVAKSLNREAGHVRIYRTATGSIAFDGVGLTGRAVDVTTTTNMTLKALADGVIDIQLPVTVTQPEVRVDDAELVSQGIKEVVTVGESDFSRSPVNRRFNIAVGMSKFNGVVIPPNSDFSFNKILGPVNGTTGFRKELVIKGDRTEPDYGGGLCQVSTTAYRGIWEYGFPILKRKNHSYTVNHYAPAGTDATVYPGSADMEFRNDMNTALLIQTYREGDLAYFIYYGTRDNRKSEIVGPFIYDRTRPPPDKIELTTDLPPGEKQKLGERVPGLKAVWYRYVQPANGGETKREMVYSFYVARPLFTAIGVASLPPGYNDPAEPLSFGLSD